MRILASLTLAILLVIPGRSFASSTHIDEWHGLKLGVATPEQALQILGKPTRDDKGAFGDFNPLWGESGPYSLVSTGTHERLHRLSYAYKRAIEGFRSVDLFFFRGKLAYIELEPKDSIPLSEIQTAYGLDFVFRNLSDGDQLLNTLRSDETPTKVLVVDSSVVRRPFYVVGLEDGIKWSPELRQTVKTLFTVR